MSSHEDANQQKRADQVARFIVERDRFARQLGIEMLALTPGSCRAAMPVAPYMVNGLGMTHGAAIFTLADFAFASACNSYGQTAVALSMDIHFLASPPPGTRLIAEASEVHCGRRTGLYRMTVSDETGTIIAEVHGMAYRKKEYFVTDPLPGAERPEMKE